MRKVLWLGTFLSGFAAFFVLFDTFTNAISAPQQAAGAAMAAAIIAIPYCMARAWDGLIAVHSATP